MGKPALDIGRLTRDERLELIEELWESLGDEQSQLPLNPDQREELDRRLDALGDEEASGMTPAELRRVVRRPS